MIKKKKFLMGILCLLIVVFSVFGLSACDVNALLGSGSGMSTEQGTGDNLDNSSNRDSDDVSSENSNSSNGDSAHEHEYKALITEPTCTGQGFTTHTCACGDSYVADYIEALGHTEVVDNAVVPTCTETGLTEGKHCSVCNEVLIAQEIVGANGHDYDSVVTVSNCTEQGYTTYTCHCGDSYVADYVEALGHTEEIDEAVEPTCTETGLTEGKHCLVCKEVLIEQEVVEANGHIPSDWIIVEDSNYTTTGIKHKICEECGSILLSEIIPIKFYTNINEGAIALRSAMLNREETFTLNYMISDLNFDASNMNIEELNETVKNIALSHTGNPKEGDYLKFGNSITLSKDECNLIDGKYYISLKYRLAYKHTLEEEKELDDFIESLFKSFAFTNETTEYEKAYTIYSYVCANIDYDNSLSNSSAYEGLIKGSTVCQGYALAMYRLLLEADVDCRFIGGSVVTSAAGHAWNIVKVDGLYYNIDATWDEGNTSFIWFLKSQENFIGHTRHAEYSTIDFCSKYFMSNSDYTHNHNYVLETVAPTCDYHGYDNYICSICNEGYRSNYVEAKGHTFVNGVCADCGILTTNANDYIITTGNCGDNINWKFNVNGTLIIAGTGIVNNFPWNYYCSNIKEIIIEDGITELGESAFNGLNCLEKITIPDSVEKIGYYAFANCFKLKTIEIPADVVEISEGIFKNCYELEKIVFPNSIKFIGYEAFYNCFNLNNVKIPNSVTDIYSFAFAFCTSLTEIELPNSLVNIYGWAFNGCTGLIELTIPEGVELIGGSAFWNCSNLTSIFIPESVKEIQSAAFKDCYSLDSVTIPEGVTTISNELFKNCTNLISVIIPNSINNIQASAFEGCENLVYNEYDNAYYLGNENNPYLFLLKAKNEYIIACDINSNTKHMGSNVFKGCTKLTTISIPNNITSISAYTFYGCDSLTSIKIPDSVTSIGNFAFYDCESLTSITIPNGVTSIGDYAFAGCDSLTSIKIPDSVTRIANRAFYECESLTSITIGDSVTRIGNSAFYYCSNLTSVYYKGTASDWVDISIESYNEDLTGATRYYYIENEADLPSDNGNYWHYVDGVPTIWIITEE